MWIKVGKDLWAQKFCVCEQKRSQATATEHCGTLRYNLFKHAEERIEQSIQEGYYCEAIAIIESVITDRLESRLSYLKQINVGFQNLGPAITSLQKCETDETIILLLSELDYWRVKRNTALHELVKIEAVKSVLRWEQRLEDLSVSANEGYELLKKLYHQVADLNPRHVSRAFKRSVEI